MFCLAPKTHTIAERVAWLLALVFDPIKASNDKTYIVTCSTAIAGHMRGVVAVVRADSESEAASKLERECSHALFMVMPRQAVDVASECGVLVASGFMPFHDLPAVSRFRVEFPYTGYACYVNADCAESAALVVRSFSGDLADGPAEAISIKQV